MDYKNFYLLATTELKQKGCFIGSYKGSVKRIVEVDLGLRTSFSFLPPDSGVLCSDLALKHWPLLSRKWTQPL